MINTFGNEVSREDFLKSVGNISQTVYITPFQYTSGRAAGIKAFNIATGSGLELIVTESRCLDIFRLKYRGMPFSFISRPGLVSPCFFNPEALEFLRTFPAGMLYTCGLTNVGGACSEDGITYPLHGRVANTPAEDVSAGCRWEDGRYKMEITGTMREAALFRENLVLRRRLYSEMGWKKVIIEDTVENCGFEKQEIMILYHFNFGYPLLDRNTRLYIPSIETVPNGDSAAAGISDWNVFSKPVDGCNEQVFYHTPASGKEGNTCTAVVNSGLKMGAYIKYNIEQLPVLVQWKSMKSGDYALGIEPANCHVEGRISERERGSLQVLMPGQKKHFTLELGVLDGVNETDGCISFIESLK